MIVARNSEPRKGDSSDGRRAAGMGAAGPGRAPAGVDTTSNFERGGAQAARRLQCLRLVRVGRQAEVRRPPGHQRTPRAMATNLKELTVPAAAAGARKHRPQRRLTTIGTGRGRGRGPGR